MAYTERFKQIEPFVGKMQRAPHAAHLSWMQRFQERVGTLIVTELGQDCPAMIVSQNTALVAAVQAEDEAYRTINRSPLSEQIAEADQVLDNTFVGLRTMVEALGRVGTAAQKDAAPRVLQAMRDYQVNISEGYELESTHIAQLVQQQGVSPYDHAIDVVNQDQEYYVQQVFPKAKLKKVKITDAISFYFTTNETWKKAVEQHPDENAGWTVTEDNELLYQTQRLLDAQGNAVDATKKVDDTKQYQLEQPADGGDVTPVTPE